MSSLLINEPPLQVLPSLATAIGLNEAIILQQIHYLLPYASTEYDDKKWVFNSIENWLTIFPFFSKNTLIRALEKLESLGLVLSEKLQSKQRNQTKFYTINYQKLNELTVQFLAPRNHPKQVNPFTQNGQMEQPKMGNSDLPKMGNCTFTQNGQMLQENTNRKQATEYIHESEYAHAQTNDCQNSQQATPTNTADPATKKQNDKTEPTLATSPSTTKKFISAQDLISLGVEPQVANDYLAIRKTKLTQTALNGIAKQSALANISLAEAIEFAAEMGWQSFKADWYFNQMSKSAPPKQTAKVFDEFGNVVSTPHEPHPNSTEAYAIRLQRETEELKRDLARQRQAMAGANT